VLRRGVYSEEEVLLAVLGHELSDIFDHPMPAHLADATHIDGRVGAPDIGVEVKCVRQLFVPSVSTLPVRIRPMG